MTSEGYGTAVISDGEGNWDSWKVWKSTTNGYSAITALQFLKVMCESYQSALSKAKDRYEDAKKKLYEENKEILSSIQHEEVTEVEKIVKETQESLRKILGEERQTYDEYHADLETYLKNVVPKGGLRKIIDRACGGSELRKQQTISRQQEERIRAQLKAAFNVQRKQQEEYRDALVRKENANADVSRSKESSRYNEEVDKLQSSFKLETTELDARFKSILNDVISNADVGSYTKMVLSSIPSASGYTCATTIPEYICLGEVSMEIGEKSVVHPEVSQRLMYEVERAFDMGTPEKLIARLPYCQSLDEGVSLFLNYSQNERKLYQEQLKMLLLKLYMSFPAGKMEATMIDPLELGETFAMFTKLGEEQSRIIDTKIWSQEKDITESINILRQKLETMTQAYGNDKQTRLKKEPIRVLAITDFPTGFTQNTLRDLQAIVRKGASYGVCVFIWANSQEIEKLQASQQSVFNEIKQMLHAATANGSVLELESAKYRGVRLSLDRMNEARVNSRAIINTLVKGIHGSQRKIERFVEMFDNIEDPNNWFAQDTISELSIPIGIKGANTIVKMIVGKKDGSTAHHALIAGQTGAGKSTLLHTIIMSTLLNYSPEEVQMYLVDFKEGVEFKTYTRFNLPSLRVVAIDSEREFGLNILKELCRELERRADMFSRRGYEEISDYRKATGEKIPKILMIFDEVQELFRESGKSDSIIPECLACLGKLVTLGRAMGIHIVLACQDFKLIPTVQPLFTSMAIRIAIKGSEDSAKSVLGDNNPGAKQLQDGAAGAAVFNDASGKESANIVFQVGYLEKEKRAEFLSKLNAFQNSEALAKKYNQKTRILLTNAEDDIFNIFNQLIINRKVETLYEDDTKYCLAIGEGFELNRRFKIGIAPRSKSNVLMVGNDEKRAASMFYFSILSLLYGELGNEDVRKDNQLVHLIDLAVEEEYTDSDNTCFGHIESLFPNQIKRVKMRDMEELISVTYDTMTRRIDGEESCEERLFLMFFGISRAHRLINANMYEDGNTEGMSALSKLIEIMKYGAQYGVNSIVWGENLPATCKIMGANIERDFAQRIVFSADNATMEQLVMEHNGNLLRPTTAVYMNIDEDVKNTHFRPFEIPAKVWVGKIARVYRDFE